MKHRYLPGSPPQDGASQVEGLRGIHWCRFRLLYIWPVSGGPCYSWGCSSEQGPGSLVEEYFESGGAGVESDGRGHVDTAVAAAEEMCLIGEARTFWVLASPRVKDRSATL